MSATSGGGATPLAKGGTLASQASSASNSANAATATTPVGLPAPLLLTAGATILAPLSSYSSNPLFYSMLYLFVIAFAYLTNPSPSTFRTHLTSLSLHSHLRLLSSPSSPPPVAFSSRIALSVRTPPYSLLSYGLFTVVTMQGGDRVWLGLFGRWWAWRVDEEKDERERKGRVEKGVDVVPTPPVNVDEHCEHAGTLGQDADMATEPQARAQASVTSTSDSTSPNRHPVPAKRASRNAPRRSSSPNHRAGAPNSSSAIARQGAAPGCGSSTTPPLTAALTTSAPAHSSALLAAEKQASASTLNPAEERELEELRVQLEELQATSSDTEKRLQTELDALREKKKDEDAVRTDLRGKIKTLEEAKRAAELGRTAGERELGERKSAVRELESKVKSVRDELDKLDKKEADLLERREKKKRDRKEREKKLADEVARKRGEVVAATNAVERLALKNESLERILEIRREVLRNRREELMRAAAIGGRGASLYSLVAPGPASQTSTHGNSSTDFNFASSMALFPGSRNRSNSSLDRVPHAPSGFLEHRLAHQHQHHLQQALPQLMSGPAAPTNSSDMLHPPFVPINGTLPSVDDIPARFLPFDSGRPSFEQQNSGSSTGSGGLSTGATKPKLSLPLQYLDSGLLASTEDLAAGTASGAIDRTPGGHRAPNGNKLAAPMSPMTPHQASLIPSQLFDMLDEDDEDYFEDATLGGHWPDSPTRTTHVSAPPASKGLGFLSSPAPTSLFMSSASTLAPTLTSPAFAPVSSLSPFPGSLSPLPWAATAQHVGMHPLSPVSHSDSRPGSTSTSPTSPDMSSRLPSPLTTSPTVTDLSRATASLSQQSQGLSLNPDAKAFAFSPPSSTMPASKTSSSSGSSGGRAARAHLAAEDDAPRSRMEFSSTRHNSGSSQQPQHSHHGATSSFGSSGSGSALGPVASSATNGHGVWATATTMTRKSPSPSVSLPPAFKSIGVGAASGQKAFNPFEDTMDDLLGPLKPVGSSSSPSPGL